MDLHDKKQPYDEHDDLEEELLEEETDDILDDEEYQEDDEEAEEESAVKDDGASQPKKEFRCLFGYGAVFGSTWRGSLGNIRYSSENF